MLSKFISFEEMKHKTYSYWAASAVIVLINIYLKRTRGPSSAAKCGSGAPFSIRIRAPLPFETLRGKRLPPADDRAGYLTILFTGDIEAPSKR